MNIKIALDIETTGMNLIEKKHFIGHKIIEIGAIQIINRKITKKKLHFYINPMRKIEKKAYEIHGIKNNFLIDKPKFKDIADKLIKFIKNKEIIIHNANFDIGFIEYELKLINHKIKKIKNICKITDTLSIARKIFPRKKNNLNALAERYKINLNERKKHGALIDSKILAKVFLYMTTKQKKINFLKKNKKIQNIILKKKNIIKKKKNKKKKINKKHIYFLKYIKKKYKKCIWLENNYK